ncbi:MAG: hypothetical protein ACE15D_00920 [Candidatus Eisenbacteria bacterium]|nr:hypothetical protein [Candidatus Eisenbacteria bacterium]
MKLLVTLSVLALLASSAVAEPLMSYGPPGQFESGPRDGTCQYGYTDTAPGQGWTLGLGQQLGIMCQAPGAILAVGWYTEFLVIPGSLDIVVYDNGVEVSRTTVQPVEGMNDFDIDDVSISGDACIMLCPIGDFWAVTGEDYNSAPYGNTYWSTSCQCTTPFTDNNLTIWATTGEAVATQDNSWGQIRSMFR